MTVRPAATPAVLAATVALAAMVVMSGCGFFGPNIGVDGVDAEWMSIDAVPGRRALVVTPAGYDPSVDGPLPVVLVLHGLGSNAVDMAKLAEWPEAGRDRGFITVFPDGVERSWNAGGCCGDAAAQGVDDVAYLDAVIDQVVTTDNGDPARVYMTGYSNGAMMTYRYVCERPTRLAGAASVAGTDFDPDCTQSAAVPFLQVSGADDPVIPPLGGESSLVGVPDVPRVEPSVLAVAAGAGCPTPTSVVDGSVTSWEAGPCRNGVAVRYDVVDGLDHSYPAAWITPEYVAVDRVLAFWGFPQPG